MTTHDVEMAPVAAPAEAADTAPSRAAVVDRRVRAAQWIVAALAVAMPIALCLRRPIAIDEDVYLHWAYEASRGRFAGADYFASHLPFMEVVFAPAFWLEHATPERAAIPARVLSALMAVASISLAFRCYDRIKGITGTGVASRFGLPVVGLAAICAGACDSFATQLVEVRPDNVSIFFLMLSVAVVPESRHRARTWASAACFVFALLSSEKLAVAVVCLVALHVAAIVVSREARDAARLRLLGPDGRDFALGLVVSTVAGVLLCTGGNVRGAAQQMALMWAWILGKLKDSGTSAVTGTLAERASKSVKDFETGAVGFLMVLAVCAASIALLWAIASFGREARGPNGARRRLHWSPTYLALLASGVLIYVVQKGPFQYSRNLLFVVAVPVIVDAIATLLSATPLPLAWALFGALVQHGVTRPQEGPTLDEQLKMLAEVRQATSPDDCVYDNSMTAYFREHAHDHYLVTDMQMRWREADRLNAEIPKAILDRGCVAMMVDFRNDGVPGPLKAFLDSHFVPVSPYYLFYGTKLPLATESPTDFYAPQASWYLADPPGATVRLAAEDPWTGRIKLEKGNHKLFVSRKETRLIWQPRDGSSKPPVRMAPDRRFSFHMESVGTSAARFWDAAWPPK